MYLYCCLCWSLLCLDAASLCLLVCVHVYVGWEWQVKSVCVRETHIETEGRHAAAQSEYKAPVLVRISAGWYNGWINQRLTQGQQWALLSSWPSVPITIRWILYLSCFLSKHSRFIIIYGQPQKPISTVVLKLCCTRCCCVPGWVNWIKTYIVQQYTASRVNISCNNKTRRCNLLMQM